MSDAEKIVLRYDRNTGTKCYVVKRDGTEIEVDPRGDINGKGK